jgi:hypothetical protein
MAGGQVQLPGVELRQMGDQQHRCGPFAPRQAHQLVRQSFVRKRNGDMTFHGISYHVRLPWKVRSGTDRRFDRC